ncbi:hypothetical protein EPA93_41985 [Ktedonosporobacter rubrisoli]|uniref:HEAT repeat domain-containing protein n=1 Tax=Ktedonosporobacter rubrisoli TaxID=2509675 RepID=A0A4P6K253_KTERU|nr:HEAT repeat domain-containing protein [Ktedonosporobacter rubrisoli]QBD82204.1 hypothetical protein EPA93_41985 [Ktedonosporobacter rubrisoli]
MISKRADDEQPSSRNAGKNNNDLLLPGNQGESIRAALALLLGPETDYQSRVKATRRLAQQGPAILPFLLYTLSNYPEITSPPWPWWPPQYEQCSYLLLQLSQHSQTRLEKLLQHPVIQQPAGPVLWVSVIEAAGQLIHDDYEELICRGLHTPWTTVRNAAAMALATRAGKITLHASTIEKLKLHLNAQEDISVQLTAAYALLSSGERAGMTAFLQLLGPQAPLEAKKAAVFLIATELPQHLLRPRRAQLTDLLLAFLQDANQEIAHHAAQALGKLAAPSVLVLIRAILEYSHSVKTQIAALTALEEMANRPSMRRAIRQRGILTYITPFLRADNPELRRQACYTFAACGGSYATAVLGTIIFSMDHQGLTEIIEALRLLHGVLRAPTRIRVVHWLLHALAHQREEIQISALDSLAYLLWKARTQRQSRAWAQISQEIVGGDTIQSLLNAGNPWVRQRTVELLGLLDKRSTSQLHLRSLMLHLLYNDPDSGVRACIAYICGQIAARWAIPGLIHTLLDPDEYVAEAALNALGLLATPSDGLICYVLREVIHNSQQRPALAAHAKALLKKLRKREAK